MTAYLHALIPTECNADRSAIYNQAEIVDRYSVVNINNSKRQVTRGVESQIVLDGTAISPERRNLQPHAAC